MHRRLFSPFARVLFVFAGFAALALVARAADRVPDVWARSVHHKDGTRTEAVRDMNTRLIEAKTYDKSNQLVMKRVFQTDEKGVPRRGFVFDGDEKLIYRLGFEYDEIGREKMTTLFDPTGKVLTKVRHHYSAEGKVLVPTVENISHLSAQPGDIRPGAAMAPPGSTDAVLEAPATPAASETSESTEAPAKKKRKFFQFFKKK